MSVYATTEFTVDLFTYIILFVGRKKSNIIKTNAFVFTILEHMFCVLYIWIVDKSKCFHPIDLYIQTNK